MTEPIEHGDPGSDAPREPSDAPLQSETSEPLAAPIERGHPGPETSTAPSGAPLESDTREPPAAPIGASLDPTPWRDAFLWGLVALVMIAGAPSLTYGRVTWDDPIHIVDNPVVQGRAGLADTLLTPGLGYPIPVTILSYRLERLATPGFVAERHPFFVHHLGNVLLMCAVVAALYVMLGRFGLSRASRFFAIALFALPPATTERVIWLSARKDLLSLLFSLLSVESALRQRRGLALLFLVLALASKPVAAYVAILFVVAAGPAWLRTRLPDGLAPLAREGKVRWLAVAAVLVALVFFALGVMGQSHVGALDAHDTGLAWVRRIFYAAGHHLLIVVGLRGPCAKYLPTWPAPFTPLVDLAVPAAMILLTLLLRSLREREHKRLFVTGIVTALVAYLPTSNLLPLTRFVADTYTFQPLAWATLPMAVFLHAHAGRVRPVLRSALALAPALLVPAFWLAGARYENSISLWRSVEDAYPDDARICRNVSIAYYEIERPDLVLAETDRCIERFGPDLFRKNRGIVLYRSGRYDEALLWLEDAAAHAREEDPVTTLYIDLSRRRIPWEAVRGQLQISDGR